MTHGALKDPSLSSPTWRRIAPIVLAGLIQCSHAPKSSEATPRVEYSQIVNVGGKLTLRPLDLGGPSNAEFELQLEKYKQFIDSTLMPQADPATRVKLATFESIIERARRDVEAFFKDPHNIADFTKANAELTLIIAAMAPNEFEAQVHVPTTLLMTADSLEELRGDVEVDADISQGGAK